MANYLTNPLLTIPGAIKNPVAPVEPIDPRTNAQAPLRAGAIIPGPAPAPGPSNPNGSTAGSGGGAAKPDKSNDIALQNAGLGAAETQRTSGLSAVSEALSKLLGQYDTESNTNEGIYKTQGETNQNNLQKNKQTALVNAVQGRQGLFSTLASLGALNGSGIELANRAVQKGANTDLTGAADNYGTNASALDTAIGQFRQDDKMRRDNADTAAKNARTNVENSVAKSKLQFLTNLANDYADMGDTARAKSFADQAAALYPSLAATTIPDSTVAYTGAAFTPGTLQNYISNADNTVVSQTPGPGSLPGLIASPVKKKTAAPVAVA